jgi:hypothetical protein
MEPASQAMTSSLPPFFAFLLLLSALFETECADREFQPSSVLLSTTIQSVVAASVFPQSWRFRLGLLAPSDS